MPNDNIISLEHISVAFDGSTVLPDVSLDVREGDFMAITGPNGGGKTTLLRVMLKLLKPDTGKVIYRHDGKIVKRLQIGYLPQKSKIDTKFPITVREAVRSGLMKGFFQRITPDEEERMEKVVEMCGIGDYMDRTVGVLSGGQLQRTLLARALVSDPKVIVLDEPLSYVDKTFEHQIYSMMENLAKTHTMILVSHEMSVISGMATRHVIVDRGIHECHAHHHFVDPCED